MFNAMERECDPNRETLPGVQINPRPSSLEEWPIERWYRWIYDTNAVVAQFRGDWAETGVTRLTPTSLRDGSRVVTAASRTYGGERPTRITLSRESPETWAGSLRERREVWFTPGARAGIGEEARWTQYVGELTSAVRAHSGQILSNQGVVTAVRNTTSLVAPRPTVYLEIRNARVELVNEGRQRMPRFVGDIYAVPRGFCGGEPNVDYDSWRSTTAQPLQAVRRSDDSAIALATRNTGFANLPPAPPPRHEATRAVGPIPISLRINETESVSVVAQGIANRGAMIGDRPAEEAFEAASETRVFRPGVLQVAARVLCASVSRANPNVCAQLRVVATAGDPGGDFPPVSLVKNRFDWPAVDLRYVAVIRGRALWQEVPARWKQVAPRPNGEEGVLVITPDQPGVFNFQASVIATDLLGRSAMTQITFTNDITPHTTLATQVRDAWRQEKRSEPPAPDSCGGACSARDKARMDPERQATSALLYRLQSARSGSVGEATTIQIAALRDEAKERIRVLKNHPALPAPRFQTRTLNAGVSNNKLRGWAATKFRETLKTSQPTRRAK